jgi:hypothetical protein
MGSKNHQGRKFLDGSLRIGKTLKENALEISEGQRESEVGKKESMIRANLGFPGHTSFQPPAT